MPTHSPCGMRQFRYVLPAVRPLTSQRIPDSALRAAFGELEWSSESESEFSNVSFTRCVPPELRQYAPYCESTVTHMTAPGAAHSFTDQWHERTWSSPWWGQWIAEHRRAGTLNTQYNQACRK